MKGQKDGEYKRESKRPEETARRFKRMEQKQYIKG